MDFYTGFNAMSNTLAGVPAGAIGALDGLFFKIGKFGRAYYFNNGEWVASARKPERVKAAIAKKKFPFSLAADETEH